MRPNFSRKSVSRRGQLDTQSFFYRREGIIVHGTTEQIFEICPRSKVRITRVFGAKWPGRSGRCREATMASLFLNYESIHTCSSVLIAVQAGTPLNFVSDPHNWSAKTQRRTSFQQAVLARDNFEVAAAGSMFVAAARSAYYRQLCSDFSPCFLTRFRARCATADLPRGKA